MRRTNLRKRMLRTLLPVGCVMVSMTCLTGCPPVNPCEFSHTLTANAGAHREVRVGDQVKLDGRQSTDSCGHVLTHSWQQVSGPAVEIESSGGAVASFVPREQGLHRFALTVSDDRGADEATVDVTAFDGPDCHIVANAGPEQTVNESQSIILNGGNSVDSCGRTLSFRWTQTAGPEVQLGNVFNAQLDVTTPDVCGDQVASFELEATADADRSVNEVELTIRDLSNGDCCDADDDRCDDGVYCNGAETCEGGVCVQGDPPCDPDQCDESAQSCRPICLVPCDNGDFCDGIEECADGECMPGVPPCSSDLICDEAADQCVEPCPDENCDDGLFCNGVESCIDGECAPGTPPCTEDESCDELLRECVPNEECEADDECDGDEICSNDGICIAPQIEISSSWSDATQPVYGELFWTLPGGEVIERGRWRNETENGSSVILEEPERATDGVHRIVFRLGADPLALADVEFRVRFLGHSFTATRQRMEGQTTHSIQLEVDDGCVVDLANSWLHEDGVSPDEEVDCDTHSRVRIASMWSQATEGVYGELFWTLPGGDQIARGRWRNEVTNGTSAISEVDTRAVNGIHTVTFRLGGPSLALADAAFRVEFLNYRFETDRTRMAGETRHSIELEVRDGCVVELSNSWKSEEDEAPDREVPCDSHETVRIASAWHDASPAVYGELFWTLPSGDEFRRGRWYNETENGTSAISEDIVRAADGEHRIVFRLGGDGLALADVWFDVEILDYQFRVTRDEMAGKTTHTILLNVQGDHATEISNSWR